MKSLKFRRELIEMMKKGEKTVTWRLFDDKELTEGDLVELVDWDSKEVVGSAVLGLVSVHPLGELYDTDTAGHEEYTSPEQMLETYKNYYGDKVTLNTEVKVIVLDSINIPA
jgi:hypothetical protein